MGKHRMGVRHQRGPALAGFRQQRQATCRVVQVSGNHDQLPRRQGVFGRILAIQCACAFAQGLHALEGIGLLPGKTEAPHVITLQHAALRIVSGETGCIQQGQRLLAQRQRRGVIAGIFVGSGQVHQRNRALGWCWCRRASD